jgi:group II intron reverse transcriptase/maturase
MEPLEGQMNGTSSPHTISTKQQRIALLARQSPGMAFTTLAHHIDIEWLKEAFRLTRKDAAPGIDGQSAEQYAVNLEGNLRALLDRAKSGTYRAAPVRRVHIPKGDGQATRPIGIPTFEDKVLQRAIVMALEPIYEQDFLDCSYGFRPRRSAHQALDSLWKQAMSINGGWIVEVDIRKFFDTLDHRRLHELLRKRVRDGVLLRLIGKWLQAGVMEEGGITMPEAGTPQGGVISPLLANVYLHEVLDTWFERDVVTRLKGRAFLVRYADDFVMGFSCEEDARRVMDVLPKRFGRYGLTLHPEKTRLVPFRPPQRRSTGASAEPDTFDLLGFTHYWGHSRKRNWVIKRKTAKGRLKRSLKAIWVWCKTHRHRPMKEQQRTLNQKLRGHYGYYGITGNSLALAHFSFMVRRIWRRWLARRSRKRLSWERFNALEHAFPLALPVVVHSALRSSQ